MTPYFYLVLKTKWSWSWLEKWHRLADSTRQVTFRSISAFHNLSVSHSRLHPWHLPRSSSPDSIHRKMFNSSQFIPKYFLLTGLPCLETLYPWFVFPFCTLYLVALVGYSLFLTVIKKNTSLHQPMYLFLAMLALAELGVSASTLPTMLGIFLFGANEICFEACLLKMFSIHSFSILESGVLLAMSVDHFVAIYNPLWYTAILTMPHIAGSAAVLGLKSVMLMSPLPFLLKHLPFCGHNVLSHSYCLHSHLIQLPLGNTRPNSILGLCIVTSTLGLDSLLIVISYMPILYTVLGISSGEGRRKDLGTCVSRVCAVLVYYVPVISVALVHRLWSRLHLLSICSWPTSIFWCLLCSIPSSTVLKPSRFARG